MEIDMSRTEKRNPRTTNFSKESTETMLQIINDENMNSVRAVGDAIEDIAKAVDAVTEAFLRGGRLIYVGAGTSGRIAVMDAAECPPTFGVDYETVITVMAGGRDAMFRAAEGVEDSAEAGRCDLLEKKPTERDVVMGISASGNAEYVASALRTASELGCVTVSLSSNEDCKIGRIADIAIFVDTGAEVISGSTRMKAGNSQKFVLNMITTCAMTKIGNVYENLMINLKPTNDKLRDRTIRIVQEILGCTREVAEEKLEANEWSIRKAVS
jgi:N-acetylmuramic acid 6-phosphate etherase